MCVRTVSYSILINGEPKGRIIPTKGLHQGDPISPYLFLLCVKGLSAMFRREVRLERIKGVSVCRGAPQISHLFFTDDSIIFCKATLEEANQVSQVLKDYEKESGQKLNKEKTSLFFRKNTRSEMMEGVKKLFGAQIIRQHEKYLGLPPMVGKGKKKDFNRIKDQVGRRIAGWKGKLLSNVGKEILIKAMAQATPTYTMSCFKIPDALCKELNSMVRNFWWGQKENERKMAWISWEKMCQRKAEGRLGFRDLKAFNLALLAKQGWRIIQNPNSLLHRVLKAKYFKSTSFLEAQVGNGPSYTWRSLMEAKSVVERGMRWNIGNGRSIDIWRDRWLPTPNSFKVINPKSQGSLVERVEHLLDSDRRAWDINKVRSTFLPFEAKTMFGIPISPGLPNDSRI